MDPLNMLIYAIPYYRNFNEVFVDTFEPGLTMFNLTTVNVQSPMLSHWLGLECCLDPPS